MKSKKTTLIKYSKINPKPDIFGQVPKIGNKIVYIERHYRSLDYDICVDISKSGIPILKSFGSLLTMEYIINNNIG